MWKLQITFRGHYELNYAPQTPVVMKCCSVEKRLKFEFLNLSASFSIGFQAISCARRAGLGEHLRHAMNIHHTRLVHPLPPQSSSASCLKMVKEMPACCHWLVAENLNDKHNTWIWDINKHYDDPPGDHQIGLAIMGFFKKRNISFSGPESLEFM